MNLLPLLLFWLNFALSQEQWRLVHHNGSVETVSGAPGLAEPQRAELVSAWVWNGRRAPHRVAPARIGREHFADDPGRLAVRITRQSSAKPPDDLRLVAAPREMWLAATEAALPSWPIPKEGRLSIPLDPGRPWQLRVMGRGEGSWWVEVQRGQRTAFLTSSPAPGIDLAVLDPQGRPAQDVNVFVQEPGGRSGTVQGWTRLHGGTGKIAVPGLPDQAEVALHILREGSPPLILRGRPSALPHEVRLPAGAALTGRLLDSRGAPVAGARVQGEAFAASDLPQVFEVKGRSGADGRWHLPALPAGKVAWRVDAAGYAPLGETVDLEPGERRDLGPRTLEPGTTLAVQVVDDAESPVAGARVRAGAVRIEATAGDDGVARLSGLPAAALEIRGLAPRHLEGALRLNPPFPRAPRLLLPRAFTITGRFVDAAGAAIPRGAVRFDAGSCQREARLAGDGRFDFDLPPDVAAGTLLLRSPETRELRVEVAPGRAGEVRDLGDLQAGAGLAVTGRIVRADDGSPVPGARIWTTRQGADGPAVAWAVRDLLETVAGEDGRFRLSGLLPAPATLRVEAAGFARAQLALPLDPQAANAANPANAGPGGTVDLGTIALAGGATLHVRVDPRSRDAAGAVARADLGNRWLEPDLLTAQVWNGEATLPNVPAGRVLVSVLAGKRLLCEQAVTVQDGGEQEVDCQRPALTVTGRVQFGGAPAGSGTLVWQVPSDVPGRIDTIVSPGGLRQQEVVGAGRPQVDVPVGADGRFATEDLVPGHWQVTWLSQGTASRPVAVDIPEGERFDTVLPFSGLAVTGTVVDREGQPVERARVREMTSGALAFTGADGSFSLTGLQPGKATVQAELEEQTSPLAEVELADRLPEPLHLVLGEKRTLTLTVRVVDAAGSPAAGAFVFLHEEGKGQRLLTTAADGRATVALEPPLAPRLRAAAYANGAWGFGSWTPRKAAEDGLTVQLTGAGSLLVHSARRQGSPAIVTAEGWDLSWLLRLLGEPPVLSVEQPLQLTGLPAGPYRVSLDGTSVIVAVDPGQVGAGTIE